MKTLAFFGCVLMGAAAVVAALPEANFPGFFRETVQPGTNTIARLMPKDDGQFVIRFTDLAGGQKGDVLEWNGGRAVSDGKAWNDPKGHPLATRPVPLDQPLTLIRTAPATNNLSFVMKVKE